MKTKLSVTACFITAAIFAFIAFFCFATVDSYWADTHHANGIQKAIGWITAVVGAVFFLLAAKGGYKGNQGVRN